MRTRIGFSLEGKGKGKGIDFLYIAEEEGALSLRGKIFISKYTATSVFLSKK